MIQNRQLRLRELDDQSLAQGASEPVKAWNVQCGTFTCQDSQQCCNRMCISGTAHCCENVDGVEFVCDEYSTCCGNACAGPNSTCCVDVFKNPYPVPPGIPCQTDVSIKCVNRYNRPFPCFKTSSCCSDLCVGEGGVCCYNDDTSAYACGEGSSCCGNVCAGPGSKCCEVDDVLFPVSKEVECEAVDVLRRAQLSRDGEDGFKPHHKAKSHKKAKTALAAVQISSDNDAHSVSTLQCPDGMTTCGTSCMPEDSTCCLNGLGFHFQCGADSACCGNACAARGDKCCNEYNEFYKYPVTQQTPCLKVCRHNNTSFQCGTSATCCGSLCLAPGGSCCQNENGHFFGCAAGSRCCKNHCAAEGASCLG